MRLDHQFTVPAPIEQVWRAVIDPERVAPCMPGATLTEVNGDAFAGTVKVKLGPISLLYKGKGEFVEKDAAAHKVVIRAAGKDSRGGGTASATVTLTLVERDGGAATEGTVATDLSITGKPAQFGRGLISEVGGKILDSFAGCLATKLGGDAGAESATARASEEVSTAGPAPSPGTSNRYVAGNRDSATPRTTAEDASRKDSGGSEAIDLMDVAGGSVAKRAAPVIGGLALAGLAVVLIRKFAGRRGGRCGPDCPCADED